jgi:hypothetical protein
MTGALPSTRSSGGTFTLALVIAAVIGGYAFPLFTIHNASGITPAESACVTKEAYSLLSPQEKIFITKVATIQKINNNFTATVYTWWAQPYATVNVVGLTTSLPGETVPAACNFQSSQMDRKFF